MEQAVGPLVDPHAGPDAWKIRWTENIPFWGVHLMAVAGVAYTGWSWSGFALAIALYYTRMFGITGGMHRYFAHRTFKTSRVGHFLLGALATTCTQKGPLWWASHHRWHHKYSDTEIDVHSPKRGFWWSQFGWILVNRWNKTDFDRVKDLARYPELMFLERFHMLFTVGFATALYFIGGFHALLWGYFVSTVLLWHGTFTINSLCHLFGRQRYNTGDTSRNSFLLALVTMGEGWHNNHHHYQSATRQGFFWWEIDVTFYILKVMSWTGLVWDLKPVPDHARDAIPIRGTSGEWMPTSESGSTT